jgi:hypothetical protein
MQNKITSARVALTGSVANLLNPPTVTGGVNCGSSPCYLLIHQVTIVNLTGSAQTCSFFLGATGASAAGTELWGSGLTIPANTSGGGPLVINTCQRVESTQFVTGNSSASSLLTVDFVFEIGVAG